MFTFFHGQILPRDECRGWTAALASPYQDMLSVAELVESWVKALYTIVRKFYLLQAVTETDTFWSRMSAVQYVCCRPLPSDLLSVVRVRIGLFGVLLTCLFAYSLTRSIENNSQLATLKLALLSTLYSKRVASINALFKTSLSYQRSTQRSVQNRFQLATLHSKGVSAIEIVFQTGNVYFCFSICYVCIPRFSLWFW